MKKYYATIEDLKEAHGHIDADGAFFSQDSIIGDTRKFFMDKTCSIFTEQWSLEGRFRGWCEEILSKEEYFKRKLAGK